ncbi:MAG: divergent polysaccharide deacetylase family protein [Rhizomicrobium sp.]
MPRALLFAWLLLAVLLLSAAGWTALFGKKSDSEPSLAFDVSAPVKQTLAANSRHGKHGDVNLIGAGAQPTAPVQGTKATLPPALVPANISKPIYAGASLIADPDLIESTPAGPLPRIADDGRSPMTAYAPTAPAVQGPKIAIVVAGLGISAKATQAAINNLPAAVTLAFLPYADDVQRWVGEARKRGHEVLLEVPMEPYDFPDSDPGPHTLRAGNGDDSNIDRLTWSLTRFTGYAGVMNLLGGRFMADPNALEPVMTFLARRGLVFFDAGPANRSAAPDVAKRTGAPYVQSAANIDAIQTGMEIDQRLSELEARARLNGSAAGTAFVYPVTIERLSAWAQGLSGRGFVLVPASAIVPANSK